MRGAYPAWNLSIIGAVLGSLSSSIVGDLLYLPMIYFLRHAFSDPVWGGNEGAGEINSPLLGLAERCRAHDSCIRLVQCLDVHFLYFSCIADRDCGFPESTDSK